MAQTFIWQTGSSGAWSVPGNWMDASTGDNPALVAPVAGDVVSFANATDAETVTGPGQAASLHVETGLDLNGSYDIGTVSMFGGVVTLSGGAVLNAGSLLQTGGNLVLTGAGTALLVGGTLTLVPIVFGPHSFSSGTITLADSATLQVGALDGGGYLQPTLSLPPEQIAIDPTASFEIGTAGSAAAGAMTVDAGETVSLPGDLQANMVNNGSLVLSTLAHAPQITGSITGSGHISVVQGLTNGLPGLFSFSGGVGAGETITPSGAVFISIPTPVNFAGTIAGFGGATQTIALPASITSVHYASGAVTLFAGTVEAGTIAFAGSYDASAFTLTPVSGEADLTADAAPCFVTGTRIRTPSGEVPVELLRVGDLVVTADSDMPQPVVWIGHRHLQLGHRRQRQSLWPVRVAANALADGLPARDLWLSPEHALFRNGVLVPVGCLLNGATIRQVPVAAVTYWHVELPVHGLILAEGTPTESYLDTGNRADFDNGGAAVRAHPEFAHPESARSEWDRRACAPQIRGGDRLAAIRETLVRRAVKLGYFYTAEMAGVRAA